MPRLYGQAESVEQIATNLLPTYHAELATARMQYVFVDKGSLKNGQPVYGKVRKLSGAVQFLVEKDFLIEVALDHWNEASESKRLAIVDHLLECCTGAEDEKTGEMKWVVREPEVQEFASILHRHGAWTDALQGMVEVAQRLNLEARVQEVVDTQMIEGVTT